MPAGLSIVDAHQHFWDLSRHAQPFLESSPALAPLRRTFSIADLRPLTQAAGVSATVVVQTLVDPAETPELLELAASEPLIGAVVGWTELTAPDVAGALAELREMPGGSYLSAIRHPLLTEHDLEWMYRPDVRRGLSAVAAAGLSFDIVPMPGQLPSLVVAVAEMADLTFVLDHMGNVEVGPELDQSWAAAFRAFAALPNTVCKVSGILGVRSKADGEAAADSGASVQHLRPYFNLALDTFGPQRMMFGSDWPVCTLRAPYDAVVAAALALTDELTGSERDAILGDTARRVYKIAG